MSDDKQSLGVPMEVKVLGNRVKAWSKLGSHLIIQPKSASFSELMIMPLPAQLFHVRMRRFLGCVKIIPDTEMTEEGQKLFRRLVCLECMLNWKGLFKRSLAFEPHTRICDLQKLVHELRIDDTLVRLLNKDERLKDLVRQVKPEYFNIVLSFLPSYNRGLIKAKGDLLAALAEFYRRPSTVMWMEDLRLILAQGLSYERRLNGIFDILDSVGTTLKDLSLNSM